MQIFYAPKIQKEPYWFCNGSSFATAQEPIQYSQITSETLIPPSRGLGSSSTAIVGGTFTSKCIE